MSTKKEYTIDEPCELTTTPISWLEEITSDELTSQSDEILLLVSQPNFQVQDTGYMSKKVTLDTFKDAFRDILCVDLVQDQIDELDTRVEQLIDLSNDLSAVIEGSAVVNGLTAGMSISDPYLISSISFGHGNLSALDGYSMKDALSAILPSENYSVLNAKKLSCAQLYVGEEEIVPISRATSTVLGTVKVADDTTPDTVNNVYARMDAEGMLYMSRARLNDALSAMLSTLTASIYNEIAQKIAKEYAFKTKVVSSLPANLEPNTIYYSES